LTEKKLKIFLPIAIMAIGAAAAVLMIKSRSPAATRPEREYTPLVRVIEVTPKKHRLIVSTHGTVGPRTETSLVAEVAGQVIEVAPSFASGGFFEKGDVLVKIDPTDYELAVVAARGQVAQGKVRAEQEEAQAKVARAEWERLGEGEASPLATRELQLQEARAALAAAEANLKKALRNLERSRIRAPFDGRVRAKLADVGRYLSPGAPVAEIYAVDYAEVRLPIPDAELAYLDLPPGFTGAAEGQSGPEVLLYADFAGARRQWNGRIVRIEGEIDPISRMVNVVAQVDDPYGRRGESNQVPLSVGLFVEADILGHELEGAVVLPRSVLRRENSVLVVDSESRLRFREVKVLRLGRTDAVITEGLRAGELVCLSTLEAMTDGMKVRTLKASSASGPDTAEARTGR